MKTISTQFVKFVLIGLLNTLIHYIVFIVLFRLFSVNMTVATVIGYIAGMLNSFIWNRSWTFGIRGDSYLLELVKFSLVNIVALLTNVMVLRLLTLQFSMLPELAQICAIAISVIVNFSGNKCWTFRQPCINNIRPNS